jgi:hypothetical protein
MNMKSTSIGLASSTRRFRCCQHRNVAFHDKAVQHNLQNNKTTPTHTYHKTRFQSLQNFTHQPEQNQQKNIQFRPAEITL